jgi:hypothetical protein
VQVFFRMTYLESVYYYFKHTTRLGKDKRSSLIDLIISDKEKSLITLTTGVNFYKGSLFVTHGVAQYARVFFLAKFLQK